MSEHKKALIPLESWCYNSPDIKLSGGNLDIGLMAEGLIYYDQILVNVSNAPQFAEFIGWFIKQDKFNELLSLLKDEIVRVYDCAFMTAAIEKDGFFSLWNIQDPVQEEPNTFEQRFLYHESIEQYLEHSRYRKKLYRALRDKVIEVKSSEFGPAIDNARFDYLNPNRSALILQAFVDEMYQYVGLGNPPEINAVVKQNGNRHTITYNINLIELSKLIGQKLNFNLGTPLTGAGYCNKFLWSASLLKCDLYLGKPMATLVGDKLFESGYKIGKSKDIIQKLNVEVEFPDVRALVNAGTLNLEDILVFREKAKKFRQWLQEEGERDRNAIIAYHHEVTQESGLRKFGRKSLQLFGVLGGAAAGAHLGGNMTLGAVAGSTLGAGAGYLVDLISKIGQDWKPVVFGNWFKNRIEKIIKE